MKNNLTGKRAFNHLSREVSDFIERFGEVIELKLYGLTKEKIHNINYIRSILELANDLIELIERKYPKNYNDMGYHFWKNADFMWQQIQIINASGILNSIQEIKDLPNRKTGIKISFEGAQLDEIVGADIKLDPNWISSQTGLKIDMSDIKQFSEEAHSQSVEEENLLENLLRNLERFNQRFEKGKEDDFRKGLYNFLKGANYNVEQNYGVEGGGHTDILINHIISMQLKIVLNKTEFDTVTGQAINDLKRYPISMAVIFDITNDRKYFKEYHKEEYKGILYYVFY